MTEKPEKCGQTQPIVDRAGRGTEPSTVHRSELPNLQRRRSPTPDHDFFLETCKYGNSVREWQFMQITIGTRLFYQHSHKPEIDQKAISEGLSRTVSPLNSTEKPQESPTYERHERVCGGGRPSYSLLQPAHPHCSGDSKKGTLEI